jgi:outer membrane protein assembly factor BamD
LAEKSIEEKKVERYHNAIDEYYGFTNEYPESTFIEEANKLFKKAKKYTTTE